MAAQLTSEYGPTWPTDHLAIALPATKRVLWNHALLRSIEREREKRRASPRLDRAPSAEGTGIATARVRNRRSQMMLERERMLAERRARTTPA